MKVAAFAKVGERGTVTIPKKIRDQIGLDKGSLLLVGYDTDASTITLTAATAVAPSELRIQPVETPADRDAMASECRSAESKVNEQHRVEA